MIAHQMTTVVTFFSDFVNIIKDIHVILVVHSLDVLRYSTSLNCNLADRQLSPQVDLID